MKYWITTDWHLNHANIIKYENRPKNYTELILKNHIKKIKPEDILINLGDVIFAKRKELKEFMDIIPAKKKILVRGNHDEGNTDTFYYDNGFDFVCDSLIIDYIQIMGTEKGVDRNMLYLKGEHLSVGLRAIACVKSLIACSCFPKLLYVSPRLL